MKIRVIWPDGLQGFCTDPFIQGSNSLEFNDKVNAEKVMTWYKQHFPQNQYSIEE